MSTTQDDPTLQPTDSAGFEKQIEALREKSDHIALPGITLAMWSPSVHFSDDLSDRSMFNDRYMQPDYWHGRCSLVLYLCALMHHFVFALVVHGLFGDSVTKNIASGNYFLAFLPGALFYIFFLALLGYFFWFCFIGAISSPPRFNRQAQIVHMVGVGGEVLNLNWRDVRPFTETGQSLSGSFNLRLYFPHPIQIFGKVSNGFIRDYYSRPFNVDGHFDSGDGATFWANLDRLEFIRRYMEHGLEAIQPDDHLRRFGHVHKPSGFPASTHNPDWWDLYVGRPFVRLLYWCATGPLIDWWVTRKRAEYRWPEEVERLCAPDADLSEFDTTPVKSRTDVFYRYAGERGYELVDAKGRPIYTSVS
ncbi:hypothetical protein BLA9940_03500 [Burkholderia aenigmatica]|uniref:Transmembrane protein n=1 Tax=Burkholderia aenigmatica TaxID=2015348 RepID=A0A6J5JL23_9BURK|nr:MULTISPECIES: hypothetical protein [Burkholderia]CAB3972553.1 hypothetical protein BLA3211_07034 [Burkholderia aenigmatica]VWC63819.1 hypothetical protein BLA9940_03500 [Burkholderia aenigmatica]